MSKIITMRFMILVIRYLRKLAPEETYLEKQSMKIERDIAYALQEEYSEKKIVTPIRKIEEM